MIQLDLAQAQAHQRLVLYATQTSNARTRNTQTPVGEVKMLRKQWKRSATSFKAFMAVANASFCDSSVPSIVNLHDTEGHRLSEHATERRNSLRLQRLVVLEEIRERLSIARQISAHSIK